MPDIPSVPSLWRFPAHPASVSRARRAVAEALPRRLRPHLGDDLGLLTSELVTNAIRYGARPEDDALVELVLWPADGHYWLAVSDPGTGCADGTLKPRHPGADAEAGRGLLLVDALAAAWAVVPRPVRGTSVVAGLPLHRGGRPK
ncbi:ATP-binding protein [Streptomyces sp. HPF1205]|uniref:ATP-binding protein n=1 Tax=Streptomyces sp. HPF1205 TaxID=2873262 RepID=UPI001CED450F|nr:ATP-binding protein [Streptomyces sp. HPF1205]